MSEGYTFGIGRGMGKKRVSTMHAKQLTLNLTAALFLGLGLAPLIALFVSSLIVDGTLSLERYQNLWTSPRLWQLFGRSLLLAGLSTLGAALCGVPLGILFGKTDLSGRSLFAILFTLPLLIPPYFLSLGWFAVLGREGWLARLLPDNPAGFLAPIHRVSPFEAGIAQHESITGIFNDMLFGLPGCVVTLSTVFLPLVMLLTAVLLCTVNPRMEEAARLYASWPKVLFCITLPAILPGILFGMLLVFLLALGELTVPMFLRYDVYPVETLIQFSAFYDFDAATATAAPLAMTAFFLLLAEWRGRRGAAPNIRPAGTSLSIRLNFYKKPLTVGVSVLVLVLVILPLCSLMLSASLAEFGEAWKRAGDALVRSLLYAAIGASLLTALGFFLGLLWREQSYCSGITEFAALLLLILPSTVIGIGLIGLWNRPETNWLYASPGILLMGYVIQYAALAGSIVHATLLRIPLSLEQAAAVAGAGWWRRVFFIVLPLGRRGFLTAWLVAYLFCLRDTGLAMLVYPPGEDTLPVRIFTLMANTPFGLVAALCALLIAAALPPLAAFGLLLRERKRLS